ncbi:MAG: sulfide/dihydroorotate dehydrogenase-like FAD/NAD-binding protein [Bacteroidales bacterium]|nr:sulfide/dihydroorotate dehydrogenase-like FAD/NAD-binding protein [Bacteroidales bacterium]MDD3201640.1 sulfide/dihydroorotate dehydrogenase-like FAD/NAD-binding protein [Bacteroidales bacterium]
MYKIVGKEYLTPVICKMEVEAPRIAASAHPGQFLIVRAREEGERIPLTICDYDSEKGTVSIVTQVVGASSRRICHLNEGESFTDCVGPLGQPSEFVKWECEKFTRSRFLFVCGGVGAAPVYPQVKFLHSKGAAVDVIIGARSSELLIFEKEMASQCDNLYICTDDGSKGEKGLVTDVIDRLMAEGNHYDCSVAIGPMVMMKFVSLTMKRFGVPLTVSLNTIMVDGTGMCGACRVTVGGKSRFACVEGPEFDGYQVDYDEAMRRQTMYHEFEIEADHKCKIGLDE